MVSTKVVNKDEWRRENAARAQLSQPHALPQLTEDAPTPQVHHNSLPPPQAHAQAQPQVEAPPKVKAGKGLQDAKFGTLRSGCKLLYFLKSSVNAHESRSEWVRVTVRTFLQRTTWQTVSFDEKPNDRCSLLITANNFNATKDSMRGGWCFQDARENTAFCAATDGSNPSAKKRKRAEREERDKGKKMKEKATAISPRLPSEEELPANKVGRKFLDGLVMFDGTRERVLQKLKAALFGR